jgi:hypothetical protein
MVADARNRDEIAFVLGHEFGHHIARHIRKTQQQGAADALILGTIMAAAQAQAAGSASCDQARARRNLENVMALGYATGQRAFSKEYALEADVIGTCIAEAAGDDAVRASSRGPSRRAARTVRSPSGARIPRTRTGWRWSSRPPARSGPARAWHGTSDDGACGAGLPHCRAARPGDAGRRNRTALVTRPGGWRGQRVLAFIIQVSFSCHSSRSVSIPAVTSLQASAAVAMAARRVRAMSSWPEIRRATLSRADRAGPSSSPARALSSSEQPEVWTFC